MKNKRKNGKVVLLNTNETSFVGDYVITFGCKNSVNFNQLFFGIKKNESQNCEQGKRQHLYIISNDRIKTGDFVLINNKLRKIDKDEFEIKKVSSIENGWIMCDGIGNNDDFTKKIIASTDNSLNLPKIKQSFIKKYVEKFNSSQIIRNVLIETKETYDIRYYTPAGGIECAEKYNVKHVIKLNSDNEVTISEATPCLDETELHEYMQYYLEYCDRNGYVTPREWIENYKHF